MKELHEYTRDDVQKTRPGAAFYIANTIDGKALFHIQRGHASLCAYLTIPASHPLARENWQPAVHGGLTWNDVPFFRHWRARWAFGWDYGHAGDRLLFDIETEDILLKARPEGGSLMESGWFRGRLWLPADVLQDSQEAIAELAGAMLAAEARNHMHELARAMHRRPRPARFDRVSVTQWPEQIAAAPKTRNHRQQITHARKRRRRGFLRFKSKA